MRQFSSKNFFYLIFILWNLSTSAICFANDDYRAALIDSFVDHQKMTAISERDDWEPGEILPVISKNAKLGVIGFVEVSSIKAIAGRKFEIRLRLIRQSRRYFIQTGDIVRRMDLTAENPDYIGSTDLIIKQSSLNISARFRPLVYQGFVIGDTAQTLYKNEVLFNYFGNVYYGVTNWLTLGTLAPANLFGGPNASFKARLYDSESTTVASGLSYVNINQKNQASLNLNLYWDSLSNDAQLTHTFVSIGLIEWEKSAEATAVKSLTSSTFQSGYEVILQDWNRVLLGPNYNFEKKALGGFVSYIWIINRVHTQISINSADITKLKLDPKDGYYGFFEVYWRY
ncbi:MAG: hypothetical protein H7061_09825 [Bdellovibrionaceae bacterium]|nr:hypothetical protein [Bdellovibrio sp.]